jgi:hypothetical protein
MNQQKWKYLVWFLFGMGADSQIHDAIQVFSRPWTGDAGQQGLIIFWLLLVISSVAIVIGRRRRAQRANSD